jgi:putative flippase GtrA
MISLIMDPKERGRFMRFAVVGVVGAVVDFGTFNVLRGFFSVLPVIAQSVSFIAAVASNFTWNRFWTYPDSRSKALSRQISQFFLVSAVGLLIRTPIFVLMERPFVTLFRNLSLHVMYPAGITPQFLGHNAALASAVLVVMMWNFFINRYWTYNDVS